jgi:hypothetical protein
MSITAPFRPLYQAQTYRDLLFVAAGIPVAAVTLGVVIAGWTSIGVLAITPLVVPILLGYRSVVGLLARADASLARSLLGVDTDPPIASAGRGFWGRAKAVLVDPNFWRQQLYLLSRMTLGFGFAVGEFSLIASAFRWITLPIWYRWEDDNYGSWHVDTLGRAFLLVPAGIAALVASGWLARALGSFSAWQVRSLLSPQWESTSPQVSLRIRRRALRIHAGVDSGVVALVVIIWASTGHGYFWPEWVMLPLALVFAIHALVELVLQKVPPGQPLTRSLAVHAGAVASLFLFVTAIWAVTTRGYFWPGWVLLGLAPPLVNPLPRRTERAAGPPHPPRRDPRDHPGRRGRGAGRGAAPDRA